MGQAFSPAQILPLLLLLAAPLFGQSAADLEFFEKKVRPIFAAKCYACHTGKTPMAGIDFSTSAGFASVVGSRLMQAVGYEAKIKMPPAGKLPPPELADIRIVRGPADIDSSMPPSVVAYLQREWTR